MHSSIVVLTYQSPDIDFYTYEIPKELEDKVKIGQLVSVPFGKRNPMGVVLETTISRSSLSVPTINLRGSMNSTSQVDNPDTDASKSHLEIKPINSIILEKPFILPYQIELLKWMSSYYLAPMVNCLETMLPEVPRKLSIVNSKWETSIHHSPLTIHQTLVLVPSINHLPQTLAQFPRAKNYVIYTNELKAHERFIVWQKILSNQCDFIFGSRSAIFAPCPNLKKIIIFDEHDGAYKDSRSPYFDTLTIAEKISELTQAKIEIFDSSPKISTFLNHSKDIKIPKYAVQTKIVSLENDRKLGNYSPISLTLEEIIKRAYSKKLSILLFLNKKIESGSIYCKNCKHQEFFKSQPEECPNCKSTEIFFNSTNINSLAKEIKKILPDSSINIFAEGLKSTVNGQVSIVTIATSSVFYKLTTHKYDLVAHIYADSPLNFNEYNSAEEVYSQIINLKKLTRKLLIIQTYNEELPAIKFATSGNYEAFYKSDLAPRKTLNYPPYALLVKISVTGKKEIEIESKSQKLFSFLKQSTVNRQLSTVFLLGPFKAPVKTNPPYNIIIKIKIPDYYLKSRAKVIAKITQIMPKQKNFKIVIEPKSLN